MVLCLLRDLISVLGDIISFILRTANIATSNTAATPSFILMKSRTTRVAINAPKPSTIKIIQYSFSFQTPFHFLPTTITILKFISKQLHCCQINSDNSKSFNLLFTTITDYYFHYLLFQTSSFL